MEFQVDFDYPIFFEISPPKFWIDADKYLEGHCYVNSASVADTHPKATLIKCSDREQAEKIKKRLRQCSSYTPRLWIEISIDDKRSEIFIPSGYDYSTCRTFNISDSEVQRVFDLRMRSLGKVVPVLSANEWKYMLIGFGVSEEEAQRFAAECAKKISKMRERGELYLEKAYLDDLLIEETIRLTPEQQDLVVDNMGLVDKIANDLLYSPNNQHHLSFEELESIGFMGLVKAAQKWDPKKGKFSTYAYRLIWGEIMNELWTLQQKDRYIKMMKDKSLARKLTKEYEDISAEQDVARRD
jgi:hypothetical protein